MLLVCGAGLFVFAEVAQVVGEVVGGAQRSGVAVVTENTAVTLESVLVENAGWFVFGQGMPVEGEAQGGV